MFRSSTVFALVIAWIWPGVAAAQQVVGNISELSGSVELQRGTTRQPATLGSAIDLHDQLTTGPNSSATVRLVDQSTIRLSDSTSMTFDENVVSGAARQRTVLRLITGAISSLVTPSPAGAFEVHTPNAVAAVRGTDFDTTYIEGSARPGFGGCQRYTDIKVREGVVEVSNQANPGETVEIDAGYETTVPCLLPPLNAGPLGIAGAVGPGAHGGGRTGSAGGAAGGAAAAAVGFAAPPPGTGSAPAPAAVPPVVQ
ncbi:MAG TPA: FecR family protein [Candidatus Binataceae bacterium]|nr:FecR family protein [Candidatus Binataceae bacterium]